MVRRFKFTLDIFRNLESPSPQTSSTDLPVTPPPTDSPMFNNPFQKDQAFQTPSSIQGSPNYIYDNSSNDYFIFKLKPVQPTLITDTPTLGRSSSICTTSSKKQLYDQQQNYLQLVSPVEDDNASSSCSIVVPLIQQQFGRRGSLVPTATMPTTPILGNDDGEGTSSTNISSRLYTPLDIKHRFLCIDDNVINLRILSKIISKLYPQADIEITTNPLQALTMIEENAYSLCFLDIEMPELSGKDLAFRVRKTNTLLGLIAVTTKASKEDVQIYEQLGIDLTFSKPLQYSYGHIMDSIESVITKRSFSTSP